MVFNQNGVIRNAQEAEENTKIAHVREQLELAKAPEFIEGNGKYNADSYFERIEDEGIIDDRNTDVYRQEDGTYEVTTTEGYIFIITLVPSDDNAEDIRIEYSGKVDGPRIRKINVTSKTTSSISVEVETVNAEGATYTYYYKKNDETEWIKAEESKKSTYTFNGLEANVIYNIRVVVEKGGKTVEKEVSTVTGELPEGAVQFSPVIWSNGQASTVITTTETGYILQYQIGGIAENNWTNTTSGTTIGNLQHGTTIYGRLFDGKNGSKTASIDIKDEINPTVVVTKGTITTNSITVSVSSKDNEWGMPTSPTYKYYIKKSTDGSYPTAASYTGTNTSYTFTGLIQGTSYDVRVTTVDKANNTGTGTLTNQTTGTIGGATGGLVTGNIIASSPTWSNGKASITLSTSTGLTVQYQVNGIDEGNWKTGTNVTGLEHNDTVYARLTDGTNYGDEASVTITDKIAPTVTVTKGTITTNGIAVSVSSKDNEWGMPTSPTYKYYIKKSTDGSYPTAASYTGTNTSYTFTGLIQGTSYDVRVTTVDKANNTGTGTLTNQTTGTIGGATGGLVTGNIIASSPTWSNGKASITLSTNTGLTIQYQVNGIDDNSWKTGTNVTGLNHNDTVYARLTDGTNYGDEASVTITDKIAPSAPTISLSGTPGNNNYYKSNVTVTITAGSDGQTGSNQVRYSVSGAQTVNQTTTTAGTTSSSITISTEGTSTITAYTIDKAGNVSTAKTQVVNKDSTAPSTASLTVGTVGENSIVVTANGADATSGVYSYEFQKSTTSATSGFSTVATQTSTATSYSYTYTGLTDGTTYYLRVIVTDRAGNTKTGTAITQKTNMTPVPAENKLKAGDYVYYTDGTGTRRTCRVLYDSSSSYGVEIITMSTVKDVTLGDNNNFSTGMNSYNNAISTLNSEASSYNNSTYSTRARCVGSVPNNPSQDNDGYFSSSYGYMSGYNGQLRDQDYNYLTDWDQMKSLDIQNISANYWLASRYVYSDSNFSNFSVKIVDSIGDLMYNPPGRYLCRVQKFPYGVYSLSDTYGLRPVFHLKSGIKVTGGSGTSSSPYTLGT